MNDKSDDNGINLRSLKQIDRNIDEIISLCGQCAVYKFSKDNAEWERKEIEGSMFIVHRLPPDEYSFVVINRLNTTNMLQTIDRNFDINITLPYLLYKNTLNEIFCIWFYDENDCKKFSQQLNNIINKLSNESNSSTQLNDIFKKLCPVTTMATVDNNGDESHKLASNGGHNGQRSQTQVSTHVSTQIVNQTPTAKINKMSLRVHDLFQTAGQTMPVIPTEAFVQNPEDLDDDVITPAMLTNQSSKTNAKEIGVQSSTVLNQPQTMALNVNTSYNQNFLPQLMVNKDKVPPSGVLSMEQLKQTLVYLLQNDADFLHSIHTAYVNGVQK
ncbi:mRNA-decapping enzyme 1A-like [Oppia nitens]|uniref:mRNA-decapping enzyme 1A-like n=1 Tax=Oppia nitens TaxID=1686743 RepID=UPI0023DCBF06|nr:mRNA-decapping enzyme 1A-like [Oppia nitens]